MQDLIARAAAQSGISGGEAPTAATVTLERYALAHADQVLVGSETLCAQLNAYGVPDERIGLLPNSSHVEPVHPARAEARTAPGWPRAPFTVVHTGSIGLKQDLGNVVEAARLLRHDEQVRFVVVGDGSQRSVIEAQGLPNVAFVDPLDDEHYPLALSAADVVVVSERPGVMDMSLPSKLTSCLAAVQDGGATQRELRRTDGATGVVPPGDPDAFAEGVRTLRAAPLARPQMAAAASSLLWQAAWFAKLIPFLMKWWLRPPILRAFGATVGERVLIRHRVRVQRPWELSIGEGAWLLSFEPITIEHDVCLSQEAFLCKGSHRDKAPAFGFDNGPIHVGAGAWVEARATVLRESWLLDAGLVPAGQIFPSPRQIPHAVDSEVSQ